MTGEQEIVRSLLQQNWGCVQMMFVKAHADQSGGRTGNVGTANRNADRIGTSRPRRTGLGTGAAETMGTRRPVRRGL